MKPEEIVILLIPVSFILMAIIERIVPARKFPAVPHWHKIGLATFVYAGLMNAILPVLVSAEWVAQVRLMNLGSIGTPGSVLVAHLIITFATFAWHRGTHAWTPLWRGFHQFHHSTRHLNIYAANMIHPTDLFVYVMLPTLVATVLLGLDPLAAAIVGNLGALCAFFQHWNVNTPQWMGWFIQRPEAHCIHHQRGVHACNYSDFPLWDMLFGSYRNPKHWQGETGFDPPADTRYGAMLAFADVNVPMLGKGSLGQKSP